MARAMKDSGVEWIGEIPERWQVGRIGQLYTERREKVSDTEYQPLSVTMKGILLQLSTAAKTDAHDDRKLVRIGDFAINSRSDRRGSCGISPYEGSVSLINTILMPRNEMHPVYYNWLFHSTMFSDEFYKWGHGIVDDLWTTNWQDMKRIAVPMPPFEEQSRIADYLDAECAKIDAVIEQTRASIEEYKKLKQSVITQAVTKGIRPGRKMKDSGVEWIGEIPEEWAVRPLKSFIDILPGYAFSSEDFNIDQGVRLLRGINVAPGSIRWDDVVYWNKEITNQIKQFELKEGDLVVGLDRPWISDGTRAAFVQERDLPCLLLQRVCRIRPNNDTDIRFVYHAIAGKSFEEALSTDTTGVSVPHISTKQIQQYLVAFPCKEEQIEISDYIDVKSANINALIQKKQQLLDELESYKKSLIFEYVTGKKEV